MGFRDAERGQAIQVGAILLFGILIIMLSTYQATVVPQQNARVEYNAYQGATDDMVSLRDGMATAATEGTTAGTTVQTGTTYPARTVFVNPGTPSGTISTQSAPNVTLDGVRAAQSEPENVREFWNATSGTYETNRVRFTPSYNEFDASPVGIAGQGVYRLPESRVLPISSGSSIRGNTITLVTARGDLGAGGRSVSVSAEPVSAASRTVTITGTGATFNVTVPTPIPATAWNDTVAPDVVANPNVMKTSPVGDDSVRITFNGSRQYELRLAAVELRAQSDASVVDSPGGAYLVGLTDNATIAVNRTRPIAVEIRDRYDNPVSGENVTFEVVVGSGTLSGGGTQRTVATDGNGRAVVEFTPDDTGTVTVEARRDLNGDGTVQPYERTVVGFTATDGSNDDGGTEEINPAKEGDVILVRGTTDGTVADVDFNNTAAENRTVSEARVSFYYASGSGQGGGEGAAKPPDTVEFGATTFEVPGQLTALNDPQVIPSGDPNTDDLTLTFTGGNKVPSVNDFVVLTLTYEETGERYTYFVTLENESTGGGNP